MVARKFLGDIIARYLGIGGATADATNVLSVRGAGSLFDGDAAGHQIRVNKDVAGDTASFLFQTGFSGRAEFGTIGNDDFELKVSDDGSAFIQAFVVDGGTGVTDFKLEPTYLGQQFWHTGDFDISDYAALTGATFTGGVIATTFEGNGANLTDVDADYLGGQSPSAYAAVAGDTFTGDVTFSGETIHTGRLSWVGGTSEFLLGVQDGNGRVQMKWNASNGTDETRLVAGEDAFFWDLSVVSSDVWRMLWSDGTGEGAGDPITWSKLLSLSPAGVLNALGDVTVNGNSVWTTADFDIADYAALTGATFTGGVTVETSAASIHVGTGSNTGPHGFYFYKGDGNVGAQLVYRTTLDELSVEDAAGNAMISFPTAIATGVESFTDWDFGSSVLTGVSRLGVGGAAPDATNTFAFYGTDLSLNSGGSINMKYNKNATGDDASMTFQQGFTTYGLMGLLGNNDFTLKVGTSFTTALVADNTDGTVSFPEGVRHDTVTAYKTSNQTLTGTGTWDDIASWDGTHIAASGNLSWTASSGQAFVGKAGRFLVSYSVSTEISTGSTRSDSLAKLQKWNGSAWVGVEGTKHRMYNRVSGRGGSNAAWQGVLDLTGSDGLKVVATVENGPDEIIVDQASISITRL